MEDVVWNQLFKISNRPVLFYKLMRMKKIWSPCVRFEGVWESRVTAPLYVKDWREWSDLCSERLILWRRPPGGHWVWGCLGCTADMNSLEKAGICWPWLQLSLLWRCSHYRPGSWTVWDVLTLEGQSAYEGGLRSVALVTCLMYRFLQ
jgi:hypothetical protein